MTAPWGRRAGWWAALVAVVLAGVAVVAVRGARRRSPLDEQQQPADVVSPVPAAPVAVPDVARVRRQRDVLAVVLVLTVVTGAVIALVPRRTPAPDVAVAPSPAVSPTPVPTPSPAEPPCVMVSPWTEQPSVPPGFIIPAGEFGFPACWNGVLGEEALLTSGYGHLVRVVVTRATEPAKSAGSKRSGKKRRESFRVHLEYAGTEIQGVDVRPVAWGAVEPATWIPAVASPFQWLRIEPGRDAEQVFSFETGDHDGLVRFRISIMPNGNMGTAEWEITPR